MNIFDFFRDKGLIQVIYIFATWFLTALFLSWIASKGESPNQMSIILNALLADKSYQLFGAVSFLFIGLSISFSSEPSHNNTKPRGTKRFLEFLPKAGKNLASTPFSLVAFITGLMVFSYVNGEQMNDDFIGLSILTIVAILLPGLLALAAIIADPESGSRYSDWLYSLQPKRRYMIGTVFILTALCIIWAMVHTAPTP